MSNLRSVRSRRRGAAGLLFGLAASAATVVPAAAGDNWISRAISERDASVLSRTDGPAATKEVETKIIGGTVAPSGKWPFIAALVQSSQPIDWNGQFCGASIIASQWILTAAHCVYDLTNAADVQVLVGTQTLSTTSTSNGTRYTVDAYTIHPSYDPDSQDYDVAVIHLSSAIPSPSTVPMLTSAKSSLADAGDNATVIGWGDTNASSATSYPTALYQVTVPVVAQKKCQKSYGSDSITDRMLCAGPKKGGKDSCQGDSGGPLLVQDTNQTWYQAGIVSWGNGCAKKKYPGVYTRVTTVESWVEGVMSVDAFVTTDAAKCRTVSDSSKLTCLADALRGANGRMAGFLKVLRAKAGTGKAAVDVSQSAWSASLTGLCRFAEQTGGSTGRQACIVEETERRVSALGAMTAALDK
ncbi:hypothetical protein ABB55_13805 [Prosthecomicrobium hirschii]|uniref:Peptidase S1 domain-containing protein n=2 Tax=Prosthecodimorpha hirschii TaxID=665126 RepID=A0A0P6W1V8_9HYPH|nr:serine protease [Prosthecomicrobium hirschii]KPL53157.1 hypothetical protein ABB55_13805 [Prosthecomicrobium hirschii]